MSSKIIVIGTARVGKTNYIKCLQKVTPINVAKLPGITVTKIQQGGAEYDMWDIDGVIDKSNYINTKAAIIVWSVDNPLRTTSINFWIETIIDSCGNIPIVACFTGADSGRSIDHISLQSFKVHGIPICFISTTQQLNIREPLDLVAKALNAPKETSVELINSTIDSDDIFQILAKSSREAVHKYAIMSRDYQKMEAENRRLKKEVEDSSATVAQLLGELEGFRTQREGIKNLLINSTY